MEQALQVCLVPRRAVTPDPPARTTDSRHWQRGGPRHGGRGSGRAQGLPHAPRGTRPPRPGLCGATPEGLALDAHALRQAAEEGRRALLHHVLHPQPPLDVLQQPPQEAQEVLGCADGAGYGLCGSTASATAGAGRAAGQGAGQGAGGTREPRLTLEHLVGKHGVGQVGVGLPGRTGLPQPLHQATVFLPQPLLIRLLDPAGAGRTCGGGGHGNRAAGPGVSQAEDRGPRRGAGPDGSGRAGTRRSATQSPHLSTVFCKVSRLPWQRSSVRRVMLTLIESMQTLSREEGRGPGSVRPLERPASPSPRPPPHRCCGPRRRPRQPSGPAP